jgi:1-acyl-sn-glycerol-3-phosphate acyltransferase
LVYYRVGFDGPAVPTTGPVLLVANHPNSLLDPVLVMAAAGRPVRFLAKAPLFSDPKTAWLVGLGGAIPVHRRQDAAGREVDNAAMFEAVYTSLSGGEVVGLFPEGISHSQPALAPLRTGAARIALGAAAVRGAAFPIVPVGLVFRAKDRFRSAAWVVRGEPVGWDDLAGAGAEDPDAVRALTERIREALMAQTVNLDAWHDRPLVETAVRIWEAERGTGARRGAGDRVDRWVETARILARVRANRDPVGEELADEVAAFGGRLGRLGLHPADLGADVSLGRGVSWAAARLPLVAPLGAAVALVGWLAFAVPYHLTALVVSRIRLEADTRSTWQALIGAALYLAWVVAAVVGAVLLGAGWWAALIAIGLPAIGMAGLLVRERWRGAWRDGRRFLLLRSRRRLIATLHSRQQDLAVRLERLHTQHSRGDIA